MGDPRPINFNPLISPGAYLRAALSLHDGRWPYGLLRYARVIIRILSCQLHLFGICLDLFPRCYLFEITFFKKDRSCVLPFAYSSSAKYNRQLTLISLHFTVCLLCSIYKTTWLHIVLYWCNSSDTFVVILLAITIPIYRSKYNRAIHFEIEN